MEIVDLDDDDLFDVPANLGPAGPAARRPGPVRVRTPEQRREEESVGTQSSVFGGLGSKASEPHPFTQRDENDAPESVIGEGDSAQIAVKKPAPGPEPVAGPHKTVDKAAALLQKIEAKAEQQKAGAWGRPSRTTAAAKAAAAPAASGTAAAAGGGQQASRYNAQGAAPPVLNESKIEFAQRRWLQTNLGGPKMLTPSGCAPPLFVLMQVLLWLLPVLVGAPLSLVSRSMSSAWLAPGIAGAAMLVIHSALQLARGARGSRVAPAEASGKVSMLIEEDDIDFALLSHEGLSFLLPALGWAALPYGLCSASLVAVATHYLAPSTVSLALGEGRIGDGGGGGGAISGATAAYVACGWVGVALATYSLNAQPPPEPSRYSPHEAGGVFGPPSRALHMLLIMIPALASGACDVLAARVLLAALPLLWAAGSLPPADCLLEWAMEQANVHLHGGSTSATPLRLGVMLVASWLVLAITYMLLQAAGISAALAAASSLSFLISHDIAPSPGEGTDTSLRPAQLGPSGGAPAAPLAFVLRRCGGSTAEAAWRGAMLAVLVVLALVLPTPGSESTTLQLLNVVVLSLCLVCRVASLLQRPYLLFLVANPALRCFPPRSASGRASPAHQVLQQCFVAAARLGGLALVIHVLMLSKLLAGTPNGAALGGGSSAGSPALVCWKLLAVTRALRKAWQTPAGALTEAALAILVGNLAFSEGCSAGLGANGWCALSPCEQWLVAGWGLSVLHEMLAKMHFLVTLALTSWTDARQRARLASTYLALLVLGSPIALAILAAAAVLAAPLLPVLGVPLFIVGFPRPKRHWPASKGSQAASLDAAYYKHLMPSAVRGLLSAMKAGQVGSNVRGGEIFLLRRDALLVMVQVLECGCGWAQLLCKGLELQETSCHHVEAGTVEEVMDSALGDCTLSSAPPALPWKNPAVFNTLEPLTKIPTTVYSLADAQLTGILDRPENAAELPRFFAYALLWLLRRRDATEDRAPPAWFDFAVLEVLEGRSLDTTRGAYLWDAEWAKAIGLWPRDPNRTAPASASASAPAHASAHSMPAAVVATAAQPSAAPAEVTPATSQPSATRHSPASSGGDAYARVQQPTCAAAVLASNTAPVPEPAGGGGMRTMRVADDMEVDDLDDLLEEFAGSNFGSRPTEPARQDWVAGGHFGSEGIDADELLGELDATLNDSSPALASSHSPSSSATTIRAHASLAPHVPSHRPQVSKKGNEVRGGGRERSAELQMWLGACWGLVEEWGHLTSKAGAEHTAMVYAGELPRSSHAKWLDEPARSELKELILSAFRYGVKLAYDSCLYGGGSSHDDMIESFTEYDKSWYLGPEDSPGWAAAVESGVPNLMAIWREKGNNRARVASLVDSHMQVGRLNGEAARGLWASLSMELYYFTNDDDERYSIQSNTSLLRNLMVQTAAPPLGYALYVCNAHT